MALDVEPGGHPDILNVEGQTEEDLEREAHHRQEEGRDDSIAHRAQLTDGLTGVPFPVVEDDRRAEIEKDQDQPDHLDPRDLGVPHPLERTPGGQIDIGQRNDHMGIPRFPGPEEIPAGASEKHTGDDQRHPQENEAE